MLYLVDSRRIASFNGMETNKVFGVVSKNDERDIQQNSNQNNDQKCPQTLFGMSQLTENENCLQNLLLGNFAYEDK
jgi:hypothetical protein